jgi:Holliday junction resolvasome RuvABC endonuclease subunit
MNLLALDLAERRTGVAAHTSGRLSCWTIDTNGKTGLERTDHIVQAINTALGYHNPDLVVVEGQSFASKGRALLDLAELHGVVKYLLWLRHRPFALVAPPTRAIYAAGKAASKDTVMLAVERRYGHLIEVGNNDEADALVLLAMACHHYGKPLADVPASHARALTSVKWPDLPGVTP